MPWHPMWDILFQLHPFLQFLSRWFNFLHLLAKPSACAWLVIVILELLFFLTKIVTLELISSILIVPPLSIFGTTLPFQLDLSLLKASPNSSDLFSLTRALTSIDLLKEIFSIPPLLIEKLHYLVYKHALE
ncbi:hypothetical protein B0H14DRAFT_3512380 [Mycena olivaceomarginata]|nr:hypothetical protein B0H14DRAFT_3512380 [Mycena olivaceomarginata]